MTSKKIFKGVAHNIADHAASYLSWIHPHIEEACLEANLDHITLDLMGLTLFHENIIISNALKSTVNQLRETFKEFVKEFYLNC